MTTPGKRLLSAETIENTSTDKKRQKGELPSDISEEVAINLADEIIEEGKDLTMSELRMYMDTILKQVNENGKTIKELATKKEYEETKDQMTAQGLEIQELRTEVGKLQDSVKNIEANVDLNFARKLNRMSSTANRLAGSAGPNMASTDQNKTRFTTSK